MEISEEQLSGMVRTAVGHAVSELKKTLGGSAKPTITRTELRNMTTEEYAKRRSEIALAAAEGRIVEG